MSQYLINSIATGRERPIKIVAIDENLVVGAFLSRSIKFYDPISSELIVTQSHQHSRRIVILEISNRGLNGEIPILASASKDGSMIFWNIKTFSVIQRYQSPIKEIRCLSLYQGSVSLCLLGGKTSTLLLYSITNNCVLHSFRGHKGPINCVWLSCFSPDPYSTGDLNSLAIISGGADRCGRSWHYFSGKRNQKYRNDRAVLAISLASKGIQPLLATAGVDKKIKIFDFLSGYELMELNGHLDAVLDIKFWEGYEILLISACRDSAIRIFDALTGECVCTLIGHRREVRSLSLSMVENIPYLVSCSLDNSIMFWNFDLILEDFYFDGANQGQRNSRPAFNPQVCYKQHSESDLPPEVLKERAERRRKREEIRRMRKLQRKQWLLEQNLLEYGNMDIGDLEKDLDDDEDFDDDDYDIYFDEPSANSHTSQHPVIENQPSQARMTFENYIQQKNSHIQNMQSSAPINYVSNAPIVDNSSFQHSYVTTTNLSAPFDSNTLPICNEMTNITMDGLFAMSNDQFHHQFHQQFGDLVQQSNPTSDRQTTEFSAMEGNSLNYFDVTRGYDASQEHLSFPEPIVVPNSSSNRSSFKKLIGKSLGILSNLNGKDVSPLNQQDGSNLSIRRSSSHCMLDNQFNESESLESENQKFRANSSPAVELNHPHEFQSYDISPKWSENGDILVERRGSRGTIVSSIQGMVSSLTSSLQRTNRVGIENSSHDASSLATASSTSTSSSSSLQQFFRIGSRSNLVMPLPATTLDNSSMSEVSSTGFDSTIPSDRSINTAAQIQYSNTSDGNNDSNKIHTSSNNISNDSNPDDEECKSPGRMLNISELDISHLQSVDHHTQAVALKDRYSFAQAKLKIDHDRQRVEASEKLRSKLSQKKSGNSNSFITTYQSEHERITAAKRKEHEKQIAESKELLQKSQLRASSLLQKRLEAAKNLKQQHPTLHDDNDDEEEEEVDLDVDIDAEEYYDNLDDVIDVKSLSKEFLNSFRVDSVSPHDIYDLSDDD